MSTVLIGNAKPAAGRMPFKVGTVVQFLPMTKASIANDPVIKELVKRIVRSGTPEQVILFGSRARGGSRPGSDYDFLVIKDMPVAARRAYRRVVQRSLMGLGVSKDVIVATPEEVGRFGKISGTVLKPALDEGITLYERAA